MEAKPPLAESGEVFRMFYTFKVRRTAVFPALVLFLLAAGMAVLFVKNLSGERVSAPAPPPCLIIDPGHGGIDGGAVSIGGAKESDLNLAIALRLQKLAELYGVETVMTRAADSGSLDYAAGSYSEHQDLVHRAEIANAVPNGLLISIHQNNYPTGQPSGAQVLYGPGEDSRRFGLLVHENLRRCLDPKNRRVASPASGIYLTDNAKCPSILVECGFMSNFADLEKLQKASYQTALAAVLAASYLQFTSGQILT